MVQLQIFPSIGIVEFKNIHQNAKHFYIEISPINKNRNTQPPDNQGAEQVLLEIRVN